MVFPGRLSTGCHICRKRKVKCDGTKPECRRCSQYGIQCTGYPDRFSFREYNPSRDTQKNGKPSTSRSNRPSPNSSTPSSSLSSPETASRAGQLNEPLPAPSQALSLCSDWQSICSLMNQLVMPVHKSPCGGHLSFLPEFFQEKGEDRCLRHAALGVSYFILYNSYRDRELYIKAQKNFGTSLVHLNKAIGSQKQAIEDETLAACLLLNIFSNLTHEGKASTNPHMSGVYHLAELRGRQQFHSKYSRQLLGWMIVQSQLQAICTGQFQYARFSRCIQPKPKYDNVSGAAVINSMIAEFCESAWHLRQSYLISHNIVDEDFQDSVRALFERANELINELGNWKSSIPPHWERQYNPEASGYDPSAIPDPWTTTFLAVTHSAQILFYLQVLTCCDELPIQAIWPYGSMSANNPLGLTESIQVRLRSLLDVVCFAVSATIGFIDQYGQFIPNPSSKFANWNTLLWPIWVVLICPFASVNQVALCRSSLNHIESMLGHNLASSWHLAAHLPLRTGQLTLDNTLCT